ncbi:NUDIX hydrolase [archaeon]|nr:NUDIX hydrolase [archaeon]
MPKPKLGKSKDGRDMHYSVGALIKKDNKFLLIDRKKPPLGFACLAGHVDENETPEKTLIREVEEESGLKVTNYKLIFEEELSWNWCNFGIQTHYWYVFECEFSGNIVKDEVESKSIGWYTQEEIKKLKLEPSWEYWFKKLKII